MTNSMRLRFPNLNK
ncbi:MULTISPECIES: erythromycin resistance leader peptide [Aneurinibacillus]